MKPINVGLLGIGTVGGGTFNVLKRNEEEITRRAGRPIRITAVEPVDIDALTDADAIPDGFASASALQHELRTIYGEKLAAGHQAFRITFECVDEVQSRESRVKSQNCK